MSSDPVDTYCVSIHIDVENNLYVDGFAMTMMVMMIQTRTTQSIGEQLKLKDVWNISTESWAQHDIVGEMYVLVEV